MIILDSLVKVGASPSRPHTVTAGCTATQSDPSLRPLCGRLASGAPDMSIIVDFKRVLAADISCRRAGVLGVFYLGAEGCAEKAHSRHLHWCLWSKPVNVGTW